MKAKPFIKWVGGKGQLIEQLEALLPADFDKWENVTYIEPFVGGGAMLFYMKKNKVVFLIGARDLVLNSSRISIKNFLRKSSE